MNGLVMTLEEDKRFYVFGCSIMWAIFPISEWRCQDIDQVLLHEIILSQCIQPQWSAKMLPFGVNCRLQLAGLGKKREEGVKPTCFTSKATSVPQTNHSPCRWGERKACNILFLVDFACFNVIWCETVLLAQMKQLSLKTEQRFSVFGTCFDVSDIIVSH